MKLLLVEDDPSLSEIIRRSLEQEHYVVVCATTYNQALERIQDYDYDLVLLDLMLPDGNGLDLLKTLKQLRKKEGVLILSAKDAVEDKVKGLELGADDYLAKPFHLAELQARIRSLIRRQQQKGDMGIEIANVELFTDKNQVLVQGKPIVLGRKEYDILLFFVNRMNHLITKEVLAEAVWGDHIDQADNFDFIYAQVKNLRKKLAEAGAAIEIKSVYGFGYKMVVNE